MNTPTPTLGSGGHRRERQPGRPLVAAIWIGIGIVGYLVAALVLLILALAGH